MDCANSILPGTKIYRNKMISKLNRKKMEKHLLKLMFKANRYQLGEDEEVGRSLKEKEKF